MSDALTEAGNEAQATRVPADHPGINELFSLLAYGEVAAFYRLTEEARMAPDLRGRINMACMAAAEMNHYEMLRDALEPLTPQWRWPQGAIGGTLCIDTGTDQPRVAAALAARDIGVDFRGSIVRLSFHAYNGVADVEAVVAAFA